MNRSIAAELGRDTARILEAGRYTNLSGKVVELADLLAHAVAGTRSYPPDVTVACLVPGNHATSIAVANESTLAAAYRLVQKGGRPVALNFASAKRPGGGFLSGALAQEETLARSSGLYACINGNPMYAFHQARSDALYTDYAIYSPAVPIIRDDNGKLLDQPYLCAFLTAPAVNAKVVLEQDSRRRGEIRATMKGRIEKVLALAAAHGHQELVLGAWGCGVFGNDSAEIAELFRAALYGPYAGVFAQVVFAILDWSAEQRFIGPFRRAFPTMNR